MINKPLKLLITSSTDSSIIHLVNRNVNFYLHWRTDSEPGKQTTTTTSQVVFHKKTEIVTVNEPPIKTLVDIRIVAAYVNTDDRKEEEFTLLDVNSVAEGKALLVQLWDALLSPSDTVKISIQ